MDWLHFWLSGSRQLACPGVSKGTHASVIYVNRTDADFLTVTVVISMVVSVAVRVTMRMIVSMMFCASPLVTTATKECPMGWPLREGVLTMDEGGADYIQSQAYATDDDNESWIFDACQRVLLEPGAKTT